MDISDIFKQTATDLTEMAMVNKALFDAHVNAGFTPEQATTVLGWMLNGLVQSMAISQAMEASNGD